AAQLAGTDEGATDESVSSPATGGGGSIACRAMAASRPATGKGCENADGGLPADRSSRVGADRTRSAPVAGRGAADGIRHEPQLLQAPRVRRGGTCASDRQGSDAALALAGRMHNPAKWSAYPCGTGFSREYIGCYTANMRASALASSRLKPVPRMAGMHNPAKWSAYHCGTGFSRESVWCYTAKMRVSALASSRLKPVPLMAGMHMSIKKRRPSGRRFA
nr:hypothetical protein [Tanacetum cinerariifolium]